MYIYIYTYCECIANCCSVLISCHITKNCQKYSQNTSKEAMFEHRPGRPFVEQRSLAEFSIPTSPSIPGPNPRVLLTRCHTTTAPQPKGEFYGHTSTCVLRALSD